jgi:hypothetical protein
MHSETPSQQDRGRSFIRAHQADMRHIIISAHEDRRMETAIELHSSENA